MSPLSQFEVGDLKLVYRTLHAHLLEHTELMDSALFLDLQRYLQLRARAEGVDIGDHGQWERWLGAAPPLPAAASRGRKAFRPETD